jgi:hypothetical protein
MGQHQVADRLVGDRADLLDHLPRKPRRRLRLDDHDAVIADDDPVLGSPSAVKAQMSRPISVKEMFFSVMSPADANFLLIDLS